MIQGLGQVQDILTHMALLPVTFTLTGPRAFGTANRDSDYDFFVGMDEANTEAFHAFVAGYGATKLSQYNGKPFDVNTSDVWRIEVGEASGYTSIDIQVSKDAGAKATIQEMMIANRIPDTPHNWTIAYKYFKAGSKYGDVSY